jgi:lysophospholipase L1-like esterase
MGPVNRRHVFTVAGMGAVGGLAAASPALAIGDAPGDWPYLSRYRADNQAAMALPAEQRRVVFMGDSITDGWGNNPSLGADFMKTHGFVGRGISGQTTGQMLIRFMPDVIALSPKGVHILAGINDIAGNNGPYRFEDTCNNLEAMTALATSKRIRVVMASVLPAARFPWAPDLGNPTAKILELNAWIKAHCQAHGYLYLDYWPVLADADQGLSAGLALDPVHPGAAGYRLMEPLALKAVSQALDRWF